jgi:hypothetical protein
VASEAQGVHRTRSTPISQHGSARPLSKEGSASA